MGLLRNALTATMCVAPSSETPFTSRMRFPIDSRPSFSAAPPDVSWGDTIIVYMHVQYAYMYYLHMYMYITSSQHVMHIHVHAHVHQCRR